MLVREPKAIGSSECSSREAREGQKPLESEIGKRQAGAVGGMFCRKAELRIPPQIGRSCGKKSGVQLLGNAGIGPLKPSMIAEQNKLKRQDPAIPSKPETCSFIICTADFYFPHTPLPSS
ncbi:hypothetical protein PHLCEN_2v2246 [Hermanssonia centrifuga]|uniref:Uncharacterized protein n=1 Tax=Hermanssonia centrifuga TaxID=98765 RepID=A0A2R6RPP8_9APHY|nr:hypothetical protein PHLCEN_2v2246 [Hermanssonia centrifuga]